MSRTLGTPSIRRPLIGGLLVAGVGAAVLLSLALGSNPMPLSDVLSALFTTVDSDNATVITSQRPPRAASHGRASPGHRTWAGRNPVWAPNRTKAAGDANRPGTPSATGYVPG